MGSVGTMPDTSTTTELLRDSFDRVRELVEQQADDLDRRAATHRVDAEANTPAWLLWHLTRVQDDHVAALAGVEQVWERWRDRFELPVDPDDIGYGHTAEQVAAVQPDLRLVRDYHGEVHAMTLDYVDGLDDDELRRVVDERWDPPVTASARLVSVLGDCLQHLGQSAFVAGVASRSA